MARRVEIDSELRRCEAELRTMGVRTLGAKAEVDVKKRDKKIPFVLPADDVITKDSTEISVYCGAVDKTFKVPLKFDNDQVRAQADGLNKHKAFTNWRTHLDPDLVGNPGLGVGEHKCKVLKSITIKNINVFGAGGGFVYFQPEIVFYREALDHQNKKYLKKETVPGLMLCRGGAVAILVVLIRVEDGARFTILTVQPRVPAGIAAFPEIPAGMLDGAGNVGGKAAEELFEETGLDINENMLCDLTVGLYRNPLFCGVYPSAGGCDEFLRLFACEIEMDGDYIEDLKGKCTGLIEEGEDIKLKIIPLEDLPKEAPDVKALSALYLYEKAFGRTELVQRTRIATPAGVKRGVFVPDLARASTMLPGRQRPVLRPFPPR